MLSRYAELEEGKRLRKRLPVMAYGNKVTCVRRLEPAMMSWAPLKT